MKKSRILILPSFYPPYGGEFCTEQAQLMQRCGYEVEILANIMVSLTTNAHLYFTLPTSTHHYMDGGVAVTAYYHRRLPKLFQYNIERWIARGLKLYEAYVAQRGHPDLIHVHTCSWAGCLARAIKQQYHTPYIITEHLSFSVVERDIAPSPDFGRALLQQAYSQCDHLVCVSHRLHADGEGWFDATRPYSVISNVTQPEFFQPRPYPSARQPFTFICANSFWYPKGYDILLQAVDLLSDRGLDFRVNIAGAHFESRPFQELLLSCRSASKLHFAGMLSRPELIALYQQSHAMVLPSREEAQSRVVLEALALGLPIVCTDIISPELINAETGLCARNEDAHDLARCMEQMMAQAHTYSPQQLSRYSYALSGEEAVAQQLSQVYESVLRNCF